MRPPNSPSEAPVAFSTLASDSVLGQRCLPSLVMRLLLLKVVGSSPAWRASPEGERLYRAARRSIARQTLWCSNMGTLSYKPSSYAARTYTQLQEPLRSRVYEQYQCRNCSALTT